MNDVTLYLVGGAVRDYFINDQANPKDFDFAVEAESYDHMKTWLLESHFEIFLESPEYFTIRARRKDRWMFADFDLSNMTYDFVLCRKDGIYSDGRRPDTVEKGTIFDDLARRDFTMNAIAVDKDGSFIDPFNGLNDISEKIIRCVGGTNRLREDGLRMVRALRFSTVLPGFVLDYDLIAFLCDVKNVKYLENISVDRIKDEMYKAFSSDSQRAIIVFSYFPSIFNFILKETNLWLMPTLKSK